MSERLRKARRVLGVQTVLDRLAEWTLVDLECQDAVLQDRRHALIRFIDSETAFAGAFPNAMMRRFEELARQHATLVAEKDAQAEQRREARARLRIAERIVEGLANEARRSQDSRELSEVIEATVECERIRQRQA